MSLPPWKRASDLTIGGLLLLLTLPLWLLTALLLLFTQGGPIFYRQQRTGKGGIPFTLYKFRTMHDGHPTTLTDYPIGRPEDARVTLLGAFLRRSAIDELPQLLNVLRGEMSLVGPRPLPVADLDHPAWLENLPAQEHERRLDWLSRRQAVLPGLTGLWQISPQPVNDFDNWIERDLTYVDAAPSAVQDLLILVTTLPAVLRGRQKSTTAAGQSVPDQV